MNRQPTFLRSRMRSVSSAVTRLP